MYYLFGVVYLKTCKGKLGDRKEFLTNIIEVSVKIWNRNCDHVSRKYTRLIALLAQRKTRPIFSSSTKESKHYPDHEIKPLPSLTRHKTSHSVNMRADTN